MLAALAGICYAMAVGDDGCRWENDILCGGTARSPGALQPNNGDAPGNGAHAQQQQERLTPYELEKKNEEDNEIQPTIFRGGAKHTMDDGHGHGSEKSADEHTLDDGHKHTKNLKSKYTGCRWENDVHCGGTAAFPGGGTGTKPPTKEEIAAAKKAKQEAPTPYELEMQNEKDNEVKPTIFDVGGSPPEHSLDDGHGHKAHPKKFKHSLDDGHEHTAKSAEAAEAAKERTAEKERAAAKDRKSHLKRKYTGCRWANDVHCGGTEANPPARGTVGAPESEDHPDDPTPFDLEMDNGKDAGNSPQIFDDSASPSVQIFGEQEDDASPSEASSKPEHSLDDGHDHGVHSDASKKESHNLNDGHDHAAPGDRALMREQLSTHALGDGHDHAAPGDRGIGSQ